MQGQEYIPGSVLIADKFHLTKYINKASNLLPDEADDVKGMFYRHIKPETERIVVPHRKGRYGRILHRASFERGCDQGSDEQAFQDGRRSEGVDQKDRSFSSKNSDFASSRQTGIYRKSFTGS